MRPGDRGGRAAFLPSSGWLRCSLPDELSPLISAAMIVRDEERHLEQCLTSLAGVVDEIVVVDTGSSDASVDIAEGHGARVFHHQWEDDFSRARNVGLEQVRGRWVLYIDADERLGPVNREELVQRLEGAREVAFRILLHPFVRSTPYYEYRLWRNDDRIRFSGVIHEKVVPAIHRVSAAEGRPIGDCHLLALEHVGYEEDQEAKHRRNLPLLQAQLEQEPRNIFNWHHLGRIWMALGEHERAGEALQRSVDLEKARPAPSVPGGMAWVDLVRLRHQRGDDVTALLAEGRARWPTNWLLVWVDGQVHLDRGRYIEAVSCFRQLLDVDTATLPSAGLAYHDRIFGSYAHASLALCYFRLGRYAEAARAYAAAEKLEPANAAYRVKRLLAESRVDASSRP